MPASLAAHLRTLSAAAGGVRPLARHLGVHWTTLHRWLDGSQTPHPLAVRAIRALGVDDVRPRAG